MAAGFGVFKLNHFYHRAMEQRLVRLTRESLEQGKTNDALIAIHQLFHLNPASVEGARLMGDLDESAGRPEAVLWRERVCQFEPEKIQNFLSGAATALRFNDDDVAVAMLRTIPVGKQDVVFHRLAGAWEIRRQNWAGAEAHFAQACSLVPDSPEDQLNLATVWLLSEQTDRMDQARTIFLKLQSNPKTRIPAIRALLQQAVQQHRNEEVLALGHSLINDPQAALSDRLSVLEIFQKSSASDFESCLSATEQVVLAKASQTAALIQWMNQNGLAGRALSWSQSFSSGQKSSPLVGLALADSAEKTANWKALADIVQSGNWGQLDFYRIAYRALAFQRLNSSAGSVEFVSLWQSAVQAADQSSVSILILGNLASRWGWHDEAENAWWKASEGLTVKKMALGSLYALYQQRKDTVGLFRVAEAGYRFDPKNVSLANNYAMFGLLINREVDEARRVASELQSQNPANPAIVSTWAFALLKEKKSPEALALLERLPRQELEKPAMALYYGLALAENGRKQEALHYLEISRQADLLPQEQQLVSEAIKKLE